MKNNFHLSANRATFAAEKRKRLMYRYCLLVVASMLFASCAGGYSIEGESSLSVLDGRTLYVKVPSGDRIVTVDSAEIIHGAFRMKGSFDSVVIASLYVGDESIMPLVIERGKIEISIDNARMTVKGTPLNNKFNDFITKKNILDDRAYEIERLESRMIMDGKTASEIRAEIGRQRKQLADDADLLAKTFIQENYGNVLGPGVFLMFCNGLPYPVLTPVMEEIIKGAPESFTSNIYVQDFVSTARLNMEKMRGVN